ncbi:MAG: hypothetical protein IT305_14670 [Chloroflexi bacterium]|nr:hypothetical protein [Chloroflexota bacterium]
MDRLSPSHWWTEPLSPIGGPMYIAFAVVLALVLVGAVFIYLIAPHRFRGHNYHRRLVQRGAAICGWLSAIGLLLLLFRWLMVPILDRRLWTYLWVLSVLGCAVYGAYFVRSVYPFRRAGYEDRRRLRQYRPEASGGRSRSGRRRRRR